jgi:hypothetical protein
MKRTFEDFAVTTGLDLFVVCLFAALAIGTTIFDTSVTSGCQGRRAVAAPDGVEQEDGQSRAHSAR